MSVRPVNYRRWRELTERIVSNLHALVDSLTQLRQALPIEPRVDSVRENSDPDKHATIQNKEHPILLVRSENRYTAEYDAREQAKSDREHGTQRDMLRVQRAICLATIAAFFAAAYYACVAHTTLTEIRTQGVAIKESADATSNAFALQQSTSQIDQRAWVTVKDIQVTRKDDVSTFIIFLTNTGKTPAEDFTIKVKGELVGQGKPFVSEEPQLPGKGIIAPNGGVFRCEAPTHESFEHFAANLAIHGRVDYTDIFNVHHWTKFCYKWIPKTNGAGGGFSPCESGNTMDNTPQPKMRS